jgi:hypothetical protein
MSASKPPLPRATLMSKRWKTLWLIVPTATLTGGAAGAPTPGLEAPKQAAVSAADIALLAGIYNVYFDEDISPANMMEMLKNAGILIAVGGSVVYGGVKLTEAGIAEVLNFVPGFGWLVSGMITASVTAAVALLWWWYCDRQARDGAIPLTGTRPVIA